MKNKLGWTMHATLGMTPHNYASRDGFLIGHGHTVHRSSCPRSREKALGLLKAGGCLDVDWESEACACGTPGACGQNKSGHTGDPCEHCGQPAPARSSTSEAP